MSCCRADSETLLSLPALSSPRIAFGCSDAAEAATVIDPAQKFVPRRGYAIGAPSFSLRQFQLAALHEKPIQAVGIHVANHSNQQKQSAFVVRN